jgi:hypothetical protein
MPNSKLNKLLCWVNSNSFKMKGSKRPVTRNEKCLLSLIQWPLLKRLCSQTFSSWWLWGSLTSSVVRIKQKGTVKTKECLRLLFTFRTWEAIHLLQLQISPALGAYKRCLFGWVFFSPQRKYKGSSGNTLYGRCICPTRHGTCWLINLHAAKPFIGRRDAKSRDGRGDVAGAAIIGDWWRENRRRHRTGKTHWNEHGRGRREMGEKRSGLT